MQQSDPCDEAQADIIADREQRNARQEQTAEQSRLDIYRDPDLNINRTQK